MTTPALIVTAHHEAAHAVTGWRYGDPLEIVSIRPGAAYAGLTISGAIPPPVGDLHPVPVIAQDPEWRRLVERRIIVTMAGAIAGHYATRTSGYAEPDPCAAAGAAAAAGLAALAPRHRELIVNAEAKPAYRTDAESVDDAIGAWTESTEEAAAYTAWLHVCARSAVLDDWGRITRLAAVLLERHVLVAPEVVAILTGREVSDAERRTWLA